MINITRPDLPPMEEYAAYLRKIWETGWLTNNGELVQSLEKKLAEYLGVEHLLLVCNGALALHLAIKAFVAKMNFIVSIIDQTGWSNTLEEVNLPKTILVRNSHEIAICRKCRIVLILVYSLSTVFGFDEVMVIIDIL